MHLSQLRSFLTIAREQNLTRAADMMHLSQSAISSQLKVLEENLGISLFERSTRGMNLSEAGQLLLPYAEAILAAHTSLQRRAETLRRGITASVKIGLNTDPTFLRISAINQRLSLLHSDLNVIFHSSETLSTAQRLKDGSIDLGFFYGTLGDPEINEQLIRQVRVCVAIPSNLLTATEPLNWNALAELPWVWVGDKFPFFQVLANKLGDISKSPSNIVTAANEQIVRELVVSGQGVALMREDEARPLAADGRVVIWEHGWSEIPLKIGWKSENSALRHIQKVRDVITHIWAPERTPEDGELSDKAWI